MSGEGAGRRMRIATERLVLRDFVLDDWRAVLAYHRDPLYLRYYPERWEERSDAEVRALVQMFVDWQAEQPRRRFQLAITLPETGEVIGNCGIRGEAESEWRGDLGYELAPGHWGRGYATEAARAMVDFAFGELKLHRLSASCIAENVASARVLEHVGLRLEGRLRHNQHFRGRWWDTLLFGMLEDEWRAP